MTDTTNNPRDRALPATEPIRLQLEALIDPSINFAAMHNDVPAVKSLKLTNAGTTDASDLELSLWIDRDLCSRWTHRLERLAAGQSLTLTTIDLPLRADALAHITERDSADLHAQVRSGDDVLIEQRWPIDVLAFDEWDGLRALPELIAAFVTPNHPAIERVLADARLHLERDTGDSALSGYQRLDPARVRAMALAIYRSVGDLALSYINPPASFELTGQRIRLPDQIIERRMATCLDLSLLLAGLFEQAGLHPLIVMVKGHAFVGLWLTEERFPEPAVDEPLRLRKRVQLGEILVLETTGLTHNPAMSFDAACDSATRRLDDVAAFHYAVDIRTARARHIRPLPLRVKPGTYDLIDLSQQVNSEATRLDIADPHNADTSADATLIDHAQDADRDTQETTIPSASAARLNKWKRKLLDLTLRNRVINHRDTKKSIPLEVPDPAALEDLLSQGTSFSVLPRAEMMQGNDPRSSELHAQRTGEDARKAFLQSEVRDSRLHADLAAGELDKRLIEIYRAARLSMEESGANTLYLVVGFLKWYETSTSEQERLAPILLLPAGLERLPAGRGYRLSLIEEDPQINVTLLEKLRAEYNIDTTGLEELTEDQSGLDVRSIFRRFREAVKDIARWDVIERVDLGLFSFNKFLMWRDLEQRSAQLIANPVVRRLVDPASLNIADNPTLPDPRDIDRTRPPQMMRCPMDADSSQLAAVIAAEEGHSFVLEGPPGTGKSQTITNLIAQVLARGKRVLFVSEKRAALEVVHRRLEKIGLGPFSLELHSNKANKRAVIEQLGQALELLRQSPPTNWLSHTDELTQTRDQLNAFVEVLHSERAIGQSVFEAGCELVRLRDTPELDLSSIDTGAIDAGRLATMTQTVQRLAIAAHAIGQVASHPYRAANLTRFSSEVPGKLLSALEPAEDALQQIGDAAASVLTLLGLTGLTPAELSSDLIRWLIKLGSLLSEPCVTTRELLSASDFDALQSAIREQIKLGEQRDADRARLFERYSERVVNEDLPTLRKQLAEGMTALPILSWFKCYSPRKRLKLCLKPGAKLPGGAALLEDLDTLIRVSEVSKQLQSQSSPGQRYLGSAWRDGQANWAQLLELLDWCAQVRDHFVHPASAALGDEPARLATMLRVTTDERSRTQSQQGQAAFSSLGLAVDALTQRLGVLEGLLAAEAQAAWGEVDEPGWLDTIASTLEAWRTDPGLLRDWSHWCSVRHEAQKLGLDPLIQAHAARVVPAGRLGEVFRKSLLSRWYADTVSSEPLLAQFHRLDHERQIERFRALDDRYLKLTAAQVQAELSARLPLQDADAHANSEVGILRRQLKLKRQHMPVRKLIASLPNLLPRLKPCLLMSPLSVAQYLDTAAANKGATANLFDLVVFDEASQIPVWDAVGALGRGAACVVVGDSKQLPPTSFFQKLESDEELPDENDFVELESILDECSATGLPSMRLLWHYRSRHESLIAFSNAHYYDHRLNTFPSATDHSEALGVTLRHINGLYDRGSTRTNPAEARALVADVVDRLRGSTRESYQSIGIVTFSIPQQTLIEDLLDQARREDPAIEVFFTDAVDEPVFVKNLENVQGDERAAIYFSVCYGPDEQGRIAMNFGPLNREGGERRLNVAVTRARERVTMYSSLRAEQIDLSRTQALGVAHLRSFLDYAQRGATAIIGEQWLRNAAGPTSIEQAVAQSLRQRGYGVDLHVGLSGYRVALAVRDPAKTGAYLLGIELDGPMYHNAATARDRDATRPAVMRSLGWRLHRLWSLDYLHNPEAQLDLIEQSIGRALRGETFDAPAPAENALTADPASPSRSKPNAAGDGGSVYEPFFAARPEGDADAFFNPAKTARVRKTLLNIAKREAPIHRDLLARRLTAAWQVSRLTAKALARVEQVIQQAVSDGELQLEGSFLWLSEQDPQRYAGYRAAADGGDAPRELDEVPPQELASAVISVLRRTIAIPREDLQRSVAELFGFSRLSPRVQPIVDEAIGSMLDSGACVIDASGKIALP